MLRRFRLGCKDIASQSLLFLMRYKHFNVQVALPFLGFSLALFSFSSIVPYVLLLGGATILNISLLTSDVWAAAARQLVFGTVFYLFPTSLIGMSCCGSLLSRLDKYKFF